jgi:hypothetical protein
MAGKVLRCVGAALLAGLFLAATAARGQTAATDQIEEANGGQTPAAIQSAENYGESQTLATNPSTSSPRASADVVLDEDSASAENTLTPEGVSYIKNTLASKEASYISDSGDAELPSAPTPATPASRSAPYTPITGRERVVWVVKGTLWPQHLFAGAITMGIATAENSPREDGPHWAGFGERYGVRLTSVAVNNTIEAGLGSLWGEDPRYFRVPEEPFGARVKNVIKMTFLTRRRDGDFAPAYARFIGTAGGNFLSNEWRPDSTAHASDAVRRTFEGLAGHMASNAWSEFWPDAKMYIFHRGKQQ